VRVCVSVFALAFVCLCVCEFLCLCTSCVCVCVCFRVCASLRVSRLCAVLLHDLLYYGDLNIFLLRNVVGARLADHTQLQAAVLRALCRAVLHDTLDLAGSLFLSFFFAPFCFDVLVDGSLLLFFFVGAHTCQHFRLLIGCMFVCLKV